MSIKTKTKTGVFVASWDDPRGGGWTTQANTLAELHANIDEAAKVYQTDIKGHKYKTASRKSNLQHV